jgi:sec-independent protein translocase protein TatA
MFGSIGFTELILILVIVLIIFGAGKLPQLGEGLGKAIKGFKKSVHEADAIEAEAQAQAQAQVAATAPPPQALPSQGATPEQPVHAATTDPSPAPVSPPSSKV